MAVHAHTTHSICCVLLGLTVLWMGGLAGCGGVGEHQAAPPPLPIMATLQQAAAQGNPKAQAFLGFLYTKGQGVPQNDAEAVKWLQAAATQGDARAQWRLGDMYNEGRGVPQHYPEAVKWWRRAAEQGDTLAQCALGDMYRLGHGVPQSFVHAYLWLTLCSASSKPGEFRDTSMQHRDAVATALTLEQLGRAQALASQWQPCTASESCGAPAR